MLITCLQTRPANDFGSKFRLQLRVKQILVSRKVADSLLKFLHLCKQQWNAHWHVCLPSGHQLNGYDAHIDRCVDGPQYLLPLAAMTAHSATGLSVALSPCCISCLQARGKPVKCPHSIWLTCKAACNGVINNANCVSSCCSIAMCAM